MNEKHKDEFSSAEDRFSELGQQAGAMFGQLFAAAEQFGKQVSKESQTWSESRPSQEPFVSALREAGEEFRATANRAAENLSDSFRHSGRDQPADTDAGETTAETDVAGGADISPGNVRKIGGGAVNSASGVSASNRQSSSVSEDLSADSQESERAEQLADIFRSDTGLSELTSNEFDALKSLLEKQYRSIREFQNKG